VEGYCYTLTELDGSEEKRSHAAFTLRHALHVTAPDVCDQSGSAKRASRPRRPGKTEPKIGPQPR